MKTRELHGMKVTEVRARTQYELLLKVAKLVRGRDVSSVSFDYLDDVDKNPEVAIVVWS